MGIVYVTIPVYMSVWNNGVVYTTDNILNLLNIQQNKANCICLNKKIK